jgi:hypothetical protein
MCTAVVGGSIHRAATRVSAASDQRSATARRNHRTKERRELLRSGVLEGVYGVVVTFQDNRPGRAVALDLARANAECGVLLSPLGTKPLAPEFH